MGKKKLAISLLVFAGVLSFSGTKAEAANQHHLLNQMHYHAINNIYKPAQNCAVLQNRILDQYCKQPATKVAYQHVQKNTQQAQAAQQQEIQQQADQQQAVQRQEAAQQQAVQQQEAAQQQAVQQQAAQQQAAQQQTAQQQTAQQQAAQQQTAQQQAAQQQAAQQQAVQQQAVQQQQRVHHNYTPQQTTGHHNRHH